MDGHVESELASLRAEVASLRHELSELRCGTRTDQQDRPLSRRAVMGLAGASVAGAVVAVAAPAGAANGDPLVLGQSNSASNPTSLTGSLSVSSLAATGVDVAAGGGNGLRCESEGGVALEAIDSGELGGIAASISSVAGRGLVTGAPLPLRIVPDAAAGVATASALEGDLHADSTGLLRWCFASAPSAAWRRVAGPATAPFTPLAPVRAYDSRWPGGAGPIGTGQARTVYMGDARAVADGAVTIEGVVPKSALAVAYNLTVVNTVATGFLGINPGGVTTVTAAAINWSADGLVLGNASVARMDDEAQLTVVCGGLGSADFVLDVVGFYE